MVGCLRLGLVLAICCGATAAHAIDCRTAIFENQRHARVIEHALRQMDRLQLQIDRVEAHNARVYIDPDKAWRATAALSGGVHTVTAFVDQCTDPNDFDQSAATVPLGVSAGVTYAPLAMKLQIFAIGRGDLFRLQTRGVEEQEVEVLGQYRGLLGGRVQITRWFATGVARVGTTRDEAENPALRDIFTDQPSDPRWLFEGSVPTLGLTARFTAEGDEFLLREAAVRAVPVTDRLSVGGEWASLATEDRMVITPEVRFAAVRRGGNAPSLDTWAEAAIETSDAGLRHLRVGLSAPMIRANLTRKSWTRFGSDITQSAALSVHTGQEMRRVSQTSAAVGGQYDVALTLHTPYITMGVDFGLGFNVPEMLDLYPGLANSLTIAMAMRFSSHF